MDKRMRFAVRLFSDFISPWLPLAVLITGGCKSGPTPMTTSLNDLVTENRRIQSALLDHHEVLSISGSLPFPELGAIYYYPGKQTDPATALGIPRSGDSCWIVGTSTDEVTLSQIKDIKAALEDLQDKRLRAVSLLADEAALEAQLANTNISTNEQASMRRDLDAIRTNLTQAETNVYGALAVFREKSNIPGVLVAQWQKKAEKGASASAGNFAQFGVAKSGQQSGFVILGGIRISSLFVGDDFKRFYDTKIAARTNEQFKAQLFPQVALVTYLLQAKYVAYVSEDELTSQLQASLSFHPKDLGSTQAFLAKVDEVKLSAYAAMSQQLANDGLNGSMSWSIKPFDFSTTNMLQNPPDGWHTVLAVLTRAPRVYKSWNK